MGLVLCFVFRLKCMQLINKLKAFAGAPKHWYCCSYTYHNLLFNLFLVWFSHRVYHQDFGQMKSMSYISF